MTEEHIKKLALKYKFKTEDGKFYQCSDKQLIKLVQYVYNHNFEAFYDYMQHVLDSEGVDYMDSIKNIKCKKSIPIINYVADQVWMFRSEK